MNVRIDDVDPLHQLGRQEKFAGSCPLCQRDGAEHTVLVQEVEPGRVKGMIAVGWACPRDPFRKAMGREEELTAIRDTLEVTGRLHVAVQARLDVLAQQMEQEGLVSGDITQTGEA